MNAIAPRLPNPLWISLFAAALLSSCSTPRMVPAAPAPVIAGPPPRAAPLPRAPADWRDAAQTPGDWTYRANGTQTIAQFGLAGHAPAAMLTCERSNGQVLLARTISAVGNPAATGASAIPLQITTTTRSQPLFSEPARGGADWAVVALRSSDPLLDAIAFSRGRFAFEAFGQPTLFLPSWPEISRVIEDCR